MTHITKCAIKAIKFYKHVVQSVEKFILKCKPEYKVPGLYVIDSIVRQSRHQFSQEKDVYAPRFTKNIVNTFQNLFKCPSDEKSKIVRVLNLWQKNAVFPIEVIQPLMDLAADPTNMDLVAAAQRAVDRIVPPAAKPGQQKSSGTPAKSADNLKGKVEPVINNQASADSILTTQTDMLNTVNQLLQQSQQPQSLDEQQQQLQQLQVLQQQLLEQTQMMQQPEDQGPVIDNTLLAQIQTLTNQLLTRTGDFKPPEPAFNKNLLDFDYGESDEDEDRKEDRGANNNAEGPVRRLLTDPALMEHIQQMSQTIQKNEQLQNELTIQEQLRKRLLQQQQEEFDQQINQVPGMPQGRMPGHPMMSMQYGNVEPPRPDRPPNMETDEVIIVQEEEYQRDRTHRGRDRSRSPKRRRRSRSRSRERRKRSRSRDRHRRSRSGDREKAREKERERWKKRLPTIKEKHVSVCSTTLFIGHLAKLTSEEELVRELENYGAVDSINMIPPRGCAFVCMNRRKDAAKAVEKMKGMKVNGSAIKIAWAPGKGLKDLGFKDEWFVDLGVTYIHWDKLPKDLSLLIDGGMLDEDTLPDHLKELAAAAQQTENAVDNKQAVPLMEPHPAQINLPPGGPPVIPPGQPPFPPPMPGMPGNAMGVLQPGPPVGMLNPMLIPMPGQTLASLPGQVGMHPIMGLTQQRMPQVNTSIPIPLMSIPNQPISTSAGSQLNAAIQNIMSSSGAPTSVNQARPQLVRPGFNSPRPGVFHAAFNTPHGYNPNVPPPQVPPPNFRLPPPEFNSGRPLGDGDSTPEQDEGQATVTKVISNDWPSKQPGRDGENRFPNPNSFGQPLVENRIPLPHDQKLLQTPPIGNRLPQPRGGAPPIFNHLNSPMNPNSPRPLLGQRLMQPEHPDMNGPHARFLSGPLGLRPFGPVSVGSPLRPQGLVEMGGPQPLMGNRFGSPRNQGQSLLGLRPGFPGARMLAPHQRFQIHQQGGPRPGFGPPMDDRMRPPFDGPNRPFDRPEFDRFGDRERRRFLPPHGNGPDDRGVISDRWGPLDGPPGVDRDLDHGRDRGSFDRFERNEFRRENDGNPDWRVNRREGRNNRMDEEPEFGQPPDIGSRRNRHGDRENQEKPTERATRDKDGRRKSRWSNLDPSQGEGQSVNRENTNDSSRIDGSVNMAEDNVNMDDSVNMEDSVNMDTSVNMDESVDMEDSIEKGNSEHEKDNTISDTSVAEKSAAPPLVDRTQLDLNAQSDSSNVEPKAMDECKPQENEVNPENLSDTGPANESSSVPPEEPERAQPTHDISKAPSFDDKSKAEETFVLPAKLSEVTVKPDDPSSGESSVIVNSDTVKTGGVSQSVTEPTSVLPVQHDPVPDICPNPNQGESHKPEPQSGPAENGSAQTEHTGSVVDSNCKETDTVSENVKGNGTVEKSPIEDGELEPGETSS